jgi:hypothetical protein
MTARSIRASAKVGGVQASCASKIRFVMMERIDSPGDEPVEMPPDRLAPWPGLKALME